MRASVLLRPMTSEDLGSVESIAAASFESPWGEDMFNEVLKSACAHCRVVEEDGRIRAYVACVKYGDEWHLMSFATEPDSRKQGFGGLLLRDFIEMAGSGSRITLEVRASNTAAITFYERAGFLAAGRRKGYYPNNLEDAVIMWRTPKTLEGRLDDIPNAAPGVS